MMLDYIIEVAFRLTEKNQFTKDQWTEIINSAYQLDRDFNNAVKYFYTDLLGFDLTDCEDLLADIEIGDGDAFERFTDDIYHFFTEITKSEDN